MPFDAVHAPRLGLLERAHEHFVAAQRIRAVFRDHVVRVDDVAAALGHLLSVLAEDQTLVDETLKRLRCADMAEIEEHLVPEARVEQVQHGVLGAADVEIDAAGGLPIGDCRLPIGFERSRHPVALGVRPTKRLEFSRIAVAEVIPARAGPLRHGVRLARRAISSQMIADPVVAFASGGSPVPVGLKSASGGGVSGSSLRAGRDVFRSPRRSGTARPSNAAG